jgi:hypothetical protein
MATAQKTPNNSYLGVIDISNPANLTIISSDLDRHVISKGYFYYGGVFFNVTGTFSYVDPTKPDSAVTFDLSMTPTISSNPPNGLDPAYRVILVSDNRDYTLLKGRLEVTAGPFKGLTRVLDVVQVATPNGVYQGPLAGYPSTLTIIESHTNTGTINLATFEYGGKTYDTTGTFVYANPTNNTGWVTIDLTMTPQTDREPIYTARLYSPDRSYASLTGDLTIVVGPGASINPYEMTLTKN